MNTGVGHDDSLGPGMVAVVGLPLDENSSFLRGPAKAPACIRKALHSESANLCAETGLNLAFDKRWKEVGDLSLGAGEEAMRRIEESIGSWLDRDVRVVCLGGDHSVTYPVVRAHAARHPGLNLLHLDAHPDLYDDIDGNRFSHGSPFARIMEERLVSRLVQIGIRTMTPHQREQANRFGVEVIEMTDGSPGRELDFDGPVYLSFDLDALDPAFAPGVSHHEPGGLSTREALGVIQGLRAPLVGADIVELNPDRDLMGMTAMVAAKLLKEILAVMLGRGGAQPTGGV